MKLVLDGRYRYIGFGGGIRASKTWGTLAVLIALCRIYPGSRWAVIRKDLERLRQTTIPSFNKLRPLAGRFVGPVNYQTFEAECTNGSRILFRGENIDKDPELSRFDGYEVNGFDLEESDELQPQTFHKSIERAGAWVIPGSGPQPNPLILCTFNPNAAWPKEVFYDPYADGTIAPPYAYVPATIDDNEAMTQEYRESLKNLPPEEYEVQVGGDWSKLSGRYYRSLNQSLHLRPRSTLPEALPDWWEYWGSYDWGYGHWAVFGAWARDTDGTTYLLDSLWMRHQQDEDQAKTIVAMMPERCLKEVYAGHDCWAEMKARGAPGITTAEVFDGYDIGLTHADIDRVNGGRAVRRALEVRAGRAGVYLLNSRLNPDTGLYETNQDNIRVFNQLAATQPDPNNINKPLKIDCDGQGRGGDDGADMFRYGCATRLGTPDMPHPGVEIAAQRAQLDPLSRREAVGGDKEMERLTKSWNRGER